jgi:flagellar hook-associated protein 1
VQQLSKLTGVSVMQTSEGETITTGNGTPLVMGNRSYSLQTTTGTDGMQHVLDSNGNDITKSIQGGQLGGAIQIRAQVIPGFLTQLNSLASELAAGFKTAQAQGFDSKGNVGQSFFTVPASGAAEGMSVSLTDPSQIAISSDGTAGSNGNLVNLSKVLTNPLQSGQTAAQSYANLVDQVGTAASDASTQSTAIGQNLLHLTNQQGSVSGVSIDEETTNLIRFQTAYEAAARIISTIQQLNSVTINMIQ